MRSRLFTAVLTAWALASCTPKENGCFDNLPQDADHHMAVRCAFTNQGHRSLILTCALG